MFHGVARPKVFVAVSMNCSFVLGKELHADPGRRALVDPDLTVEEIEAAIEIRGSGRSNSATGIESNPSFASRTTGIILLAALIVLAPSGETLSSRFRDTNLISFRCCFGDGVVYHLANLETAWIRVR